MEGGPSASPYGYVRVYRCMTCKKEFEDEQECYDHSNTHSGLYPYRCEYCGKAFQFKRKLEKHGGNCKIRRRSSVNSTPLPSNPITSSSTSLDISSSSTPSFPPDLRDHDVLPTLSPESNVRDDEMEGSSQVSTTSDILSEYPVPDNSEIGYDPSDREQSSEIVPVLPEADELVAEETNNNSPVMEGVEDGEEQIQVPTNPKMKKKKKRRRAHGRKSTGQSFTNSEEADVDFSGEMASEAMDALSQNSPNGPTTTADSYNGIEFPISQGPTTSMASRIGNPNFSCGLCGLSLKSEYLLEDHIRRHTGEKPFVCPKCTERFHGKSDLQKHKMLCLYNVGIPNSGVKSKIGNLKREKQNNKRGKSKPKRMPGKYSRGKKRASVKKNPIWKPCVQCLRTVSVRQSKKFFLHWGLASKSLKKPSGGVVCVTCKRSGFPSIPKLYARSCVLEGKIKRHKPGRSGKRRLAEKNIKNESIGTVQSSSSYRFDMSKVIRNQGQSIDLTTALLIESKTRRVTRSEKLIVPLEKQDKKKAASLEEALKNYVQRQGLSIAPTILINPDNEVIAPDTWISRSTTYAPKRKRFCCPTCDEILDNTETLYDHIQFAHDVEIPIEELPEIILVNIPVLTRAGVQSALDSLNRRLQGQDEPECIDIENPAEQNSQDMEEAMEEAMEEIDNMSTNSQNYGNEDDEHVLENEEEDIEIEIFLNAPMDPTISAPSLPEDEEEKVPDSSESIQNKPSMEDDNLSQSTATSHEGLEGTGEEEPEMTTPKKDDPVQTPDSSASVISEDAGNLIPLDSTTTPVLPPDNSIEISKKQETKNEWRIRRVKHHLKKKRKLEDIKGQVDESPNAPPLRKKVRREESKSSNIRNPISQEKACDIL